MGWTPESAGSQKGRTVLITGANTGLGFENARSFARLGARVILACRNADKASAAVATIRAEVPDADLQTGLLDVSNLASVRTFASQILGAHERIDLLINNAGVMIPPREVTPEGFELQFVTNYVGHFLLTGLLLPRITSTAGSRIVTLSSLAHWDAKIDLENLNAERAYARWPAYGQSKLACLIFARELQRRLAEKKFGTLSLAAHPGGSKTELGRHSGFIRFLEPFAQSAYAGSLPTMRAALDPLAQGGAYYGPRFEIIGPPTLAWSSKASKDPETALRLWRRTEHMTGVRYP